MEQPKFRISTWVSLAIGIEGILLGFSFNYSWSLSWTLVILLITVIVFLIGCFIDFFLQYRKFFASIKDIHTRHSALSEQFEQKNKILDDYEKAFTYFGHSLITATTILNEKERPQVDNLHSIFLAIKKSIRGEKYYD